MSMPWYHDAIYYFFNNMETNSLADDFLFGETPEALERVRKTTARVSRDEEIKKVRECLDDPDVQIVSRLQEIYLGEEITPEMKDRYATFTADYLYILFNTDSEEKDV